MNDMNRERGAVAVMVAVSLLLLMGATALALDGGLAYNERRATQNAADNVALAAAWAECHGEDAQAAATEVAVANGFDDNAAAIQVEITAMGEGEQHVVITSTQQATVAPVVGIDEVTVLSEAIASCEESAGASPYVLFAGAPPTCSGGMMIPSSSKTINGGLHTNGTMNISGPVDSMYFNGHTTYVEALPAWMENQYGDRFFAGHSQSAAKDFPVPADWVIPNYAPGGAKAELADAAGKYTHWPSGMNTSAANVPEGLNFVDGNVNIYPAGGPHGSGNSLTNTTIVATGNMTISGQFNDATPYENDGLLLFGNSGGTATCWNNGLQMSGSMNSFEGTIYFPNGKIGINNDTMVGNGAIIGYTVNLASSTFVINPSSFAGGTPSYTIELMK